MEVIQQRAFAEFGFAIQAKNEIGFVFWFEQFSPPLKVMATFAYDYANQCIKFALFKRRTSDRFIFSVNAWQLFEIELVDSTEMIAEQKLYASVD
ncbi:hypothetical protein [Methylomonas albis]|uniref:hypothetical protein n=1 Tax=Methylomonas albis TaxID=1854563 RepID=UPI0019F95A36|nr:hypothetical protein [Methylomonas albis]CAD6882139.1 hypothetical protein [Methylomonas albis]